MALAFWRRDSRPRPATLIVSRPRPRNTRELDEEGKRTNFIFNVGTQLPEVVIAGEETIAARSRGKDRRALTKPNFF
jgi:hypothetical protein